MAKFSTYGARTHEASALGVARHSSSTEGTDVLRALGADMFSGLALEASYHDGGGGFCVRNDDGVAAGSGLHNHLQSSREHNTSSAHSRSSSSVHPSPSSLSQYRIPRILFPGREGRGGSGSVREGVGSSAQLGRRVDDGVGKGSWWVMRPLQGEESRDQFRYRWVYCCSLGESALLPPLGHQHCNMLATAPLIERR